MYSGTACGSLGTRPGTDVVECLKFVGNHTGSGAGQRRSKGDPTGAREYGGGDFALNARPAEGLSQPRRAAAGPGGREADRGDRS
jgi:hypothetical protein